MDDGFFDGLPIPESTAGAVSIVVFILLLIGLWLLVRRTRERHIDELEERRRFEPPPEPDDPTKLPGE